MRILLNVNSLTTPHLTGIGVYIVELAKRLRDFPDIDLVGAVKLSRTFKRSQILKHLPIPLLPEEACLHLFPGIFDLYHGPDFRIPKTSRIRKIVTVHDLVTYRSEMVDPRFEQAGQAELNQMLRTHGPDGILVNSEFTRQELIEFFPELKEKISLSYLGCDHIPLATGQEPRPTVTGGAPYFLSVGTLERRKNIHRIIESFHKFSLQNSQHHLVIVGNLGFDGESALELIKNLKNPRIHKLGFASAKELRSLYAHSTGLFFPSLYEGFGFPILEAMRSKCPVITSNMGAMKEVAGNAAVLVDPKNCEALVDSLQQLSGNESLREDLKHKGILRAQDFTWKKTAEASVTAYRKL